MAFDQIDKNLIDQYSANVQLLAQEKTSQLLPFVEQEVATGERTYFEQYGVHDDPEEVKTRLKDYDLKDAKTARRAVDIKMYTDTRPVDNFDKIRMLADMESQIVKAQAAQFGRQIDKNILTAARNAALTGKTGSTSVTLPAASKVAIDNHDYDTGSGNVGMTVGKAQKVMALFDEGSFELDDRVLVLDPFNFQTLISDAKASSTDYIEYRPFRDGMLPYFLGMRIIRLPTAFFAKNSTTGIYNIAFARSAMKSVSGQNGLMVMDISEDKRKEVINTYVARANLFHASTRMQEGGVIEIENVQTS